MRNRNVIIILAAAALISTLYMLLDGNSRSDDLKKWTSAIVFVNSSTSASSGADLTALIAEAKEEEARQNLALIYAKEQMDEILAEKNSYIESIKEDNLIDKSSSKVVMEPPKLIICPYDFTVYVYELPSELATLAISEQARKNQSLHVCKKCILEQFSLEYIMYDFFTQFCGRTKDPHKADFFYLPLIRDPEFRLSLEDKTKNKMTNRAPSQAENALINILEKNDSSLWKEHFQITDRFWHRRQGADHIIVMPAPVTNLRHEASHRGFHHYMVHLFPPIFIGLEYSYGFIEEYPVCASQKNIIVPYPTTDPDLYSGRLFGDTVTTHPSYLDQGTNFSILNALVPNLPTAVPKSMQQRDALIFYAGGTHGDCIEVRRAMKFLMMNSSKLVGIVPATTHTVVKDREQGFLDAVFCPIPVGDSPSSKRMYDVLNFGCIPVIISDDLVWAFSSQSGGPLNTNKFAIQVPQAMVQFPMAQLVAKLENSRLFSVLPSGVSLYSLMKKIYHSPDFQEYINGTYVNPLVHLLRHISFHDIAVLQQGGRDVAQYFRYYALNSTMSTIPTATHSFPDGGAMTLLSYQLTKIKYSDTDQLREKCSAERSRKHKYKSRYACQKSIRRR